MLFIKSTPSKQKKKSFLKKTFLSFLSITIIITILLTSFLTTNYLKTTVNMAYDFNKNLLSQSNYSITYFNGLANSLSNSLCNNKDIIAFLNADKKQNDITVRAFQTLTNQLLPLNYIESVYMYNSQIDMLISSKYGEQQSTADFFDKDISNLLLAEDISTSPLLKPFPHTIKTLNGKKNICSYSRIEVDKVDKEKIASALIVNLDTKTLTNSIQAINSFDKENIENKSTLTSTQFAAIDKNGFVLDTNFTGSAHVRQAIIKEIEAIIKSAAISGNTTITAQKADYLLSYSNQNENGWYIFGVIPKKNLLKDITYTSVISLIVVIILFLLSAGICFYFAKRLNSPIKQITDIVNGKNIDSSASIKTDEFQMLTSVFRNMKEQNDSLNRFSGETEYTIKQNLLNNLVSGKMLNAPEKIKTRLLPFKLEYLCENKLCMCILKIDSYTDFFSINNQRERFTMLYAIVNISAEILDKSFHGEVFSANSDKFVILIKCESDTNFNEFKISLVQTLEEIQDSIKKCLSISVSAAYSPLFSGVEHISSTYSNLEELIQMKMKYGHGCLISPDMFDEIDSEYFQIPINEEEMLLQNINSAKACEAIKNYQQISNKLFEHNYSEIMSYIIHLAYTIHASVQLKNPYIKQDVTSLLKNFMASLHNCEVFKDVDLLLISFIKDLCNKIDTEKGSSALQNNDIITQKMCKIIEKDYDNSNLCLSYIAEIIDMSPNYIGHIFKSVQNVSVSKYILDLRMKKVAYYLKNSKLSLDEIALKVGMEKNNYFYTCFKKSIGVSLSEYKLNRLD